MAIRPITPAELDLADIRLDAQTAAGMTTADTERPDDPEDVRFARGVVVGLLCAIPLWVAIVAWVVWRAS